MTTAAFGPDGGLRRTVLANGLTVLSEHMPGVRSVALGAWVRAASLHEPPERMGVSHLLEHMVFKGTANRSARELALALEVLGGSLDAYTAREHTSYQARVLDQHLPEAADVLADLIFRPTLRAEDLRLERKVVLEEISMVEDTPDDLVFELHNGALWGDQPHGYAILGTRETVRALGVRELRALHARAYHPAQIVVAAAGNVEHERLLEVLERCGWFAQPAGDATPLPAPAPVPLAPSTRHVPRDLAQTHLVFGAPTVAYADPRRYVVSLVSTLLGGGMSSRLFQRVREELGLAYAVHTFQSFHVDVGVHGVYVATAPESAAAAADAIRAELATLAEHGLPEDELAMGKSQLKGQIVLSLDSVSARMYRAAALDLYGAPYRSVDEVLALVDAITPAEAAAICAEHFDPARQTILSLGPAAPAAA
ncbi:MAG TPA: pitrilysin family protein [Gemmatimonadaceae bacterium]|nr:pitrilysin family protein [Gemmatimonadaceae bacterium]